LAPTKALVNDLYYRLDSYLGGKVSGSICRYTGDHHDFQNPAGGFLLLATPEALDSLQLMNPDKISGVRAVVIDEIHLLHGNARGQQLRHVLNRIEKNCLSPSHAKDVFQRIGMTATIDDIETVGKLWLKEGAATVALKEQRAIDLILSHAGSSQKEEKPGESALIIHHWLHTQNLNKVIVFGNSRNETQKLAVSLHTELSGTRWPVHWHTGILAKGERERVEEAMKRERFGICVATSTLEVGIDIGDVDAIVLYDPPHSVGSFLQRIGRGNRKTGRCRVLGIFCNEAEKILYTALHDCARNGILDDVHEYDRSSVRFQQVLSFAWKGTVRGSTPLNINKISDVTCDDTNNEIVNDMLETGALRVFGDSLIPSDDFIDIGERRLLHTVLSGGATTKITDGTTGDPLLNLPGKSMGSGFLFVGGAIKQLVTHPAGDVSLERTSGSAGYLVQLPATRGKRQLSRNVVWSIARQKNEDPRIWKYYGKEIMTWGGEYNRLLALLIKINMKFQNIKVVADEYTVKSSHDLPDISPAVALEWCMSFEKNTDVTLHEILPFCEKGRFFSDLSGKLQWQEAFRSIPLPGFKRWLSQCIEIQIFEV
jgi:ATP-dependent Lhr-like helicase